MKRLAALVLAFALGVAITSTVAWGGERQLQMHAALRNLREARGHLEKAQSNKGGFREIALKHVNEAVDAVLKGIEYDNKH